MNPRDDDLPQSRLTQSTDMSQHFFILSDNEETARAAVKHLAKDVPHELKNGAIEVKDGMVQNFHFILLPINKNHITSEIEEAEKDGDYQLIVSVDPFNPDSVAKSMALFNEVKDYFKPHHYMVVGLTENVNAHKEAEIKEKLIKLSDQFNHSIVVILDQKSEESINHFVEAVKNFGILCDPMSSAASLGALKDYSNLMGLIAQLDKSLPKKDKWKNFFSSEIKEVPKKISEDIKYQAMLKVKSDLIYFKHSLIQDGYDLKNHFYDKLQKSLNETIKLSNQRNSFGTFSKSDVSLALAKFSAGLEKIKPVKQSKSEVEPDPVRQWRSVTASKK